MLNSPYPQTSINPPNEHVLSNQMITELINDNLASGKNIKDGFSRGGKKTDDQGIADFTVCRKSLWKLGQAKSKKRFGVF